MARVSSADSWDSGCCGGTGVALVAAVAATTAATIKIALPLNRGRIAFHMVSSECAPSDHGAQGCHSNPTIDRLKTNLGARRADDAVKFAGIRAGSAQHRQF